MISKDKRAIIFEKDDADFSVLVRESMIWASGKYLHIVTSGTTLNATLYAAAVKRLKDAAVKMFICGMNLRFSENYVRIDTSNFKKDLLPDGKISPQNNKFLIYACGINLNNKIFNNEFIRTKKMSPICFDEEGNSPALVLGAMNASNTVYIERNNLTERLYRGSNTDIQAYLDEFIILKKAFKNEKMRNSFVNLFANELYYWLSKGNCERKFLLQNRDKIKNIIDIEKHTRGYFYNGYIYDVLLNFLYSKEDPDDVIKSLAYHFDAQHAYEPQNMSLLEDKPNVRSAALQMYAEQKRTIEEERDSAINRYNALRNSYSYRIGRLLLFFPRKIYRCFVPDNSLSAQENRKQKSLKLLKRIDDRGERSLKTSGEPLVSIIMPMYNVSPYIEKCLGSLICQTYKNIEIICVDDGSDDDSCDKVSAIMREHTNISLYRQNHRYAGVARNYGFRFAKGKYTIFLDSDDYFESDFVRSMVIRAEGCRADITVCRCRGFENETNKFVDMKWSVHDQYLPKKNVFGGKELGKYACLAFMGWAWDKLYSTKFIRKHGLEFQAIRSSNDAYFTFTSILRAKRISVVDRILINQRRNIKTSISQTRSSSWDNCFKASDQMFADWKKKGLYSEKTEQAFCNWFVQFFGWHYFSSNEMVQKKMAETAKLYAQKYNLLQRPLNYFYMKEDYEKFLQIIREK